MKNYVEYKVGDLFSTTTKHIAHGVNAQGYMGGGVAKVVANLYPNVEAEYVEACKSGELQKSLFQLVETGDEDGRVIVNVLTQIFPGAEAKYALIFEGFHALLAHLETLEVKRLALPRVGAGIGGLSWGVTARLLEILAEEYKVVLEVWVPEHEARLVGA